MPFRGCGEKLLIYRFGPSMILVASSTVKLDGQSCGERIVVDCLKVA